MSGKALRVLNSLLGPEKRNESPGKGNLKKAYAENSSENFDKLATENPASLNPTPVINSEVGSTGGDGGNSEVEYIESENLHDVEDVDTSLSTLFARLDSKNWVLVCEALNHVRQLSIFHKEAMLEMLGNVISLIVKSLKSPRSAVCKTAIMTSADIFRVYSDHIVDSFDPLLVQLLLKSSQDKRFVCEAAERALVTMTTWVSPNLLLPKLQPHLKHKNPRIRAKASMCFCRSVPRLGTEGINAYGIDKLIQVAASQLSDQLPESREAARTLALELQTVYEKSHITETTESQSGHITETTEFQSRNLVIDSWEDFCQAKLSPLSAQAILRVTSVAREGGSSCWLLT